MAKLFADIEQNTLRNIQERSLREQQRHDAPEEQEDKEDPEGDPAGLETPTFPGTVYQGEGEDVDGLGGKTLQEDPFEVVAPVTSEHAKPDERSLDAVLEFEHSLEEKQMEGESTSCTFLSDDSSDSLSHTDTPVTDVSSSQSSGSGSEDSCTTTNAQELAERHTSAEPTQSNTADHLANHNTDDTTHSGTQNSDNPWLQGTLPSQFLPSVISLSANHFSLSPSRLD